MKALVFITITFFAYSTRLPKVDGRENSEINSGGNGNISISESWKNFEKLIKDLSNDAFKKMLPFLMENSAQMNLSKECMKNSMYLLSGLKDIKPWAIRFVDSSAKMIDGMMVGTLASFGVYDECINTVVKGTRAKDKHKILFRGQYCLIEAKLPVPPETKFYKMDEVLDELKNFSQGDTAIAEVAKYAQVFQFLSLRLGICLPTGCSLEDINKVARLLSGAAPLNVIAPRCDVKEENNFSPFVIFLISYYCFFGFLVLVGSLIDIYAYYRKITFKNMFIRVLVAFSLLTNFRKFVNTKTASDTLSCLNGVRFFCMSWVIVGHTYSTISFYLILGLEKVKELPKDFAFQVLANGTLVVDTFFFVGGLLVCYVTINMVRNRGQVFSVRLYIFHRLWRIIPVYASAIMSIFMFQLMGSGPMWYESTHKSAKACYDNWWTNLIFINNFYHADNMCFPQSWYLAADFQLYIAALIILIPIIRWPKVGILLSVVGIIASVIYSGVSTYVNNYPPALLVLLGDPVKLAAIWSETYFKPYIHASSYCIGLLAGYLLATKPGLKIPPIIQVIGWSVAFICSFSALYGVFEWNKGRDPLFWEGLMYATFSRTSWTLGVAWMIICCATGHGGVINYILSWKAFVPLGRLTYISYLIHPLVQIAAIGSIRTKLQPDHYIAVWLFFGHLAITYACAFVVSMLIETPFISLEKIILIREKKAENIENIVLEGKNCDTTAIVSKNHEESRGIENIGHSV